MTLTIIPEKFEDTPIDVFIVGRDRWARGVDITTALGFADPKKAMEKILTRNRAEFDDSTTIMIEMPTAGGPQLTRLYNARGAALIAMKAQTPKGEDFRRWVLDVLEGKDDSTPVDAATNVPAGVLGQLRKAFIGAKGNTQLLRYVALGLGSSEIGRLIGVSPSSVNTRRRVAEYLGLADAPGEFEGPRRRNFEKMLEARRVIQAASRERKRLALPAPDETPEEVNRRRDAETARIERANARRENGNG